MTFFYYPCTDEKLLPFIILEPNKTIGREKDEFNYSINRSVVDHQIQGIWIALICFFHFKETFRQGQVRLIELDLSISRRDFVYVEDDFLDRQFD